MRVAAGIALALLFMAGLWTATLRETRVECEVCIAYGGGRVCRTSAGADRDRAIQMAQSTACAVLANGVTQNIQCGRAQPVALRCEE